MSKQFVEGNVYVFTKKAFLREERREKRNRKHWNDNKEWANHSNGLRVCVRGRRNGEIKSGTRIYFISPEWCKCIKRGFKDVGDYV